ncbi:MAG TPA: cysteine desulfurase [Phycisphaerae bacterium]|nr:cysteine desulfurase [Phycisphaerae bacterium]
MTTAATRAPGACSPPGSFDPERARADFPALAQLMHGRPLVYLDNAATTQKPRAVIDALRHYYEADNANIHRGVHALSVRATQAHERARAAVQGFIGAARPEEIIFVHGTTEAINLVAQTYGRMQLGLGDEILITGMEHHSNIVPWQMLAAQTGARLRVVPLNERGALELDAYARLLGPATRLVALAHVSNALGTINPVAEMIALAHAREIPVLVDGAQAVPHMRVDVRQLDADFYAFSGHKLFGPTGIGVLYGKRDLLETLPPYQGGGDMIRSVTFEHTTYNDLPYRFEAGTPNIAGAIGLGAAIDYLSALDLDAVQRHEADLLAYATEALTALPQVRLIGTADHKTAVLSFVIEGVHPHDAGTILDQVGVALRTGHHCAQPVMAHFGVPATCRASLALYNTRADIDALVAGVRHVCEVFKA